MEMLKILKLLIIVLSFGLFCVQFRIAFLNLLDPPMVDSSYERDITLDDMPIITICPMNQTNTEKVQKLKFLNRGAIMRGRIGVHTVSWGAHVNLTYEEMLSQLFDTYISSKIYAASAKRMEEKFMYRLVYIPMFGICQEIYKYGNVTDVNIFVDFLDEYSTDYMVFITDNLYRSYFMPDLSSHVGSKVVLKRIDSNNIKVQIRIESSCTEKEKAFTNNDYNNCINEELDRKFTATVGCIPPMFASVNQCDSTYTWKKFKGISKDWYENIIYPLENFDNSNIEMKCRKSCLSIKHNVNERGITPIEYTPNAIITFEQKVFVTEKVANYSLFQFIIDVGSSLGLWLGLSVLGLHDLVVIVVEFTKNSLLCRQMRNALQK